MLCDRISAIDASEPLAQAETIKIAYSSLSFFFSGRKETGNINYQIGCRGGVNLERAIYSKPNREMPIENLAGLEI